MLAVWRWPVQALTRVNGRLAIRNVTARSVAMSAAVMPVMLAVGISTANLYMQTTQVHASSEAFTRDLRADAVLVSDAGLSPTVLEPGPGGAWCGECVGVRHAAWERSTSLATLRSTRTALR